MPSSPSHSRVVTAVSNGCYLARPGSHRQRLPALFISTRPSVGRRRNGYRGLQAPSLGRHPSLGSFSLPDPGRGEVLIEVEACGVGLTVMNCMSGALSDSPDLLPVTPGHEVVGRVAAVGEGVDSRAIGDRVIAYFYLSCFQCQWCLRGRGPAARTCVVGTESTAGEGMRLSPFFPRATRSLLRKAFPQPRRR